MKKKKPIVKYTCLQCGTTFDAEQGSQRFYCDKHLAERVKAGKKIEK